jgi:hypothetical protein
MPDLSPALRHTLIVFRIGGIAVNERGFGCGKKNYNRTQ